MSLWTIIPVKPLTRGKSRLSGVLSEEDRSSLNYRLLRNTLHSLAETQRQHVMVVSRDPAALSVAREFDFLTLQEDDAASDLNLALKRAAAVVQMYGATALLVLPADLPLVDSVTIGQFLQRSTHTPGVVIAPDRRHEGTNALWVSPPGLIEFQFGPDSFRKHKAQAEALQVSLEIVELPTLELDLDMPDDLLELERIDPSFSFR
jgi:2-phospho-L-lactate guanylyltransferase